MSGHATADGRRQASDPPLDHVITPILTRTDTVSSSGDAQQQTISSVRSKSFGSFGRIFRSFELQRADSPLVNSPSPLLGTGSLEEWFASSDEESNSLRTRTSSFLEQVNGLSGRIITKATDFRPYFGKKRQNKIDKKYYPKPKRKDVLDKDETQKLIKFWTLTERSDQTSEDSGEKKCSISEFLAIARSPTQTSAPADTSARFVYHPRLPSISEHSRDVVGPLPQFKMDTSLLTPGSRLLADQEDKNRRVKDAKEMFATIARNAERSNTPLPPYEFLELIGKGSFGRVYKARDKKNGNLVAIKITNVENPLEFDETVRDFQKEVSTLQQLKSNRTKNVNVIHDAFDLHSQLWIVADYCTGGSVRTLMRAWEKNGRPYGLPEHYIIPIARELAIALKGMHEMHIIHRDIKCANVYITEEGDIQLGDFGVVGVIDDGNSKRKTVIGTPHYMPKELIDNFDGEVKEGYGTEVDIWSYGCTIYEMATGRPPHAHLFHGEDISKNIEKGVPSLEGADHSADLRDLVAFCLKMAPKERPTADAILNHPLIANTSKQYPTSSLVRLIERYKIWEHGGGSRASLWMAAPSDATKPLGEDDGGQQDDVDDDVDGWNFSTSDDFDRRFSQMPSFQDGDMTYLQAPEGSGLPPGLAPIKTQGMSVAEMIKREHSELSANRGEKSLARVFNTSDEAGYQLSSPPAEQTPPPIATPEPSDLPLRNFTSNAPTRESMIEIDLDSAIEPTASSTFAMHMDATSQGTIKPAPRKAALDEDDDDEFQFGEKEETSKRDTMAWTFPKAAAPEVKRGTMDWTFSTAVPAQPDGQEDAMDLPPLGAGGDLAHGFRPSLKHSTTEPIGHFRDFSHDTGLSSTSPTRHSVGSVIDLDMGLADPPRHLADPAEIVRPSTASSTTGSTMTDMTSGNPFDLEEDPVQNELDRTRFSYHKAWQSEGGQPQIQLQNMRLRGSSLSSTDSHHHNGGALPPFSGLSLEHQDDPSPWPDFDSGDSPHYLPTNGNILPRSRDPSTDSRGGDTDISFSQEPTIDFPALVPPDPRTLHDDADPRLLEDELGHALNDLATALSGVELSLRKYASVPAASEGYEAWSDLESGAESSALSQDEEGDGGAFLTAKRRRPRERARSPSAVSEVSGGGA